MYAVIESGGKQHKVVEGEVLKLEKIDAEAGETVSFDKVMMIGSDEKVTVGQPYVDAGSVSAEVVTHGRHDKINIIKICLLYTSPSPRDYAASRMPSSA